MTILALDPGTTETGWCHYGAGIVFASGVAGNQQVLQWLERRTFADATSVAIEMIASYGMPVGREVFETCIWIGEFKHACRARQVPTKLVYRKDVKLHLCGTTKAKDPNVWQALMDRFGGPNAVGKKANPGPLYGVKSHARAALAVAITAMEQHT